MGLFDFFKKKELATIREKEAEIAALKTRVEDESLERTRLEERNKKLESYACIINIDEAKAQKERELALLKQQILEQEESSKKEISRLEEDTKIKRQKLKQIKKEIALYKEDLALLDHGIYSPHFNYATSEEYKDRINEVRDKQKLHIKHGTAAVGGEGISWGTSLSQGQAMIGRIKKLMIRAFNGECDYLISTVSWNNINKYEQRIEKSFDSINKTLDKQGVYLSYIYMELKIEELYLAHEYQVKKKEEQEEQRAIREQMREEERAIREIEQARLKAEKEEAMYRQMLEKARKEMGTAVGEKQAQLLARIAELESGLIGAEALKTKAISMAQQTKMGYVYVISNIGSFGEDVFKIGMTRRLEPLDRVRELGDASVPFPFDVHAMIFSENAPELESQLHKAFATQRVNLVNDRKEFFHVTLGDIKQEADRLGAKTQFTMLAEASEYRESKVIKSKMMN